MTSSVCSHTIVFSCNTASFSSQSWISFALEAIVSLLGFDGSIIPETRGLLKKNYSRKMRNLKGILKLFCAWICWYSDGFSLHFEVLWLVDVTSWYQPVKLPPGRITDLWLLSWPLISAVDRWPLIIQNETIQFTEQSLEHVPPSSTEKKESARWGSDLKLVLNNGTEPINGFSHICITTANVDLLKSGDIATWKLPKQAECPGK